MKNKTRSSYYYYYKNNTMLLPKVYNSRQKSTQSNAMHSIRLISSHNVQRRQIRITC